MLRKNGSANLHRSAIALGCFIIFATTSMVAVEVRSQVSSQSPALANRVTSGSTSSNRLEMNVSLVRVQARSALFQPYAVDRGATNSNTASSARSTTLDFGRQTKPAIACKGGVNFLFTSRFSTPANYLGRLFKVPDYRVPQLNLAKVANLTQPSVGVYCRF